MRSVWSGEAGRMTNGVGKIGCCVPLTGLYFKKVSFFKLRRPTNDVPGIAENWLSKSSDLKCSEHRWEVGVNVHFARLTRKKLIHSRLLFVSCFFGNLCNLMFFEGSGTFEQFPAVHLLGILKNRWRKTIKKTIIFTITSGLCYV